MKFFRNLALLVLIGFLCNCTPVRTKNFVDRVYELDPQGKIFVSRTLADNPPKTVAVLPFRSQIGEGASREARNYSNSSAGADRRKDAPSLLRAIRPAGI